MAGSGKVMLGEVQQKLQTAARSLERGSLLLSLGVVVVGWDVAWRSAAGQGLVRRGAAWHGQARLSPQTAARRTTVLSAALFGEWSRHGGES